MIAYRYTRRFTNDLASMNAVLKRDYGELVLITEPAIHC